LGVVETGTAGVVGAGVGEFPPLFAFVVEGVGGATAGGGITIVTNGMVLVFDSLPEFVGAVGAVVGAVVPLVVVGAVGAVVGAVVPLVVVGAVGAVVGAVVPLVVVGAVGAVVGAVGAIITCPFICFHASGKI
jgi:hypothetical protein